MSDETTADDQLGDPNENFFYCLATAHGEWESFLFGDHEATHELNKAIWHRWWWEWLQAATDQLGPEIAADLAKALNDKVDRGLTDEDRVALRKRCGKNCQLILPADWVKSVAPRDAEVDWRNLRFDKSLSADGFVFLMPLAGHQSHWMRTAGFNGTTFEGEASFSSGRFKGLAWFMGATFKGLAWFLGATVKDDAWFNGATFERRAWFTDATFDSEAGFATATFESGAWFTRATFTGPADFRDFGNKQVSTRLSFEGASFLSSAEFTGRRFARVPQFMGATLESDNFVIDESDEAWPAPGDLHDDQNEKSRMAENVDPDTRSYERLASEMNKRDRKGLMLLFIAKEVEGRRRQAAARVVDRQEKPIRRLDSLSRLIVLSGYRLTSNYGRSIGRPTGWLIGLWALFGMIYRARHHGSWLSASLRDSRVTAEQANKVYSWLEISLAGALPILTRLQINKLETYELVMLFGHSLASLTLIFLIGLGIRNNLRLG